VCAVIGAELENAQKLRMGPWDAYDLSGQYDAPFFSLPNSIIVYFSACSYFLV
jgi:hypothetical protein